MVSGSVSQGDPGAGNNTGPPATGEGAPAPADKQVKENSAGQTMIETVQNFLPTNWIHNLGLGNKTEQEHPQLEPAPTEKGEKKCQNPEV